jgi:DNA primase
MSDIDEIKQRIDVVDFIGEYVALKSAGVNHKGLCPFHHEKSPSFMVSRERNSWHCFGCSKGGDIFSFVQEIEGMEFIEALKFLADRAGVPLTMKKNDVDASQKNRLKDIHAEAARFFHHILLQTPQAGAARDYLTDRGVTQQTQESWQIGYIPDQWDLLTTYLFKKGYSFDDVVASGFAIQKEGSGTSTQRRCYDRFRGRIMFPIRDVHGYIVGFTGRVLVETEKSGGKYVNTPQTVLYDKSRILFGLYQSKQEIKKQDLAVVVEGQMDVIACHQAGMTHVVASSGTALTDHQIQLLSRYTKNIAVAFDADVAGQNAAKRGIDIARQQGMNVKVIRIPEGAGKDPDECIKKDPSVWFGAVQNATDWMIWSIEKAFEGKSLQNPRDKQAVSDALLPEIARIPYAVEKDHWLREVAGRLGVDVSVLQEDLIRLSPKPVQTATRIQAPDSSTQKQAVSPRVATRIDRLAHRVFMLFFTLSDVSVLSPFEQPVWQQVSPELCALYEWIKSEYTTDSFLNREHCPETLRPLLERLLLEADQEFGSLSKQILAKEVNEAQTLFVAEWKKQERQTIQRSIEQAEKRGDTDAVAHLITQFQILKD